VSGDIVERLRRAAVHRRERGSFLLVQDDMNQTAADEITRLRSEHTFVERLVAGQLSSRITELEGEITRLRAAGDALAEAVCGERIPLEMLDPLTEWEEARRGDAADDNRSALIDAHHVLRSEDK